MKRSVKHNNYRHAASLQIEWIVQHLLLLKCIKTLAGILSWKYRGVAVNQQTGIMAMTDWVQWNYEGGSMFGNVRFYDLIANPAKPIKVGQERLAEAYSGVPGRVVIDGNYAYVATVMVGLQIVNVEKSKIYTDDPGSAIEGVLDTVNLDQCPQPGASGGSSRCGNPHDIVVYRPGKALLTTTSRHLLLLDMSNPQLPQPMNFFYPASTAANLFYEGVWTVGATADYAYIDADGNDQVKDLAVTAGGYPSGKIHIVDITDPFNPAILGVVRDALGGILSILANDIAIDKSSGLVYVADNNAVYVIDIKNPNDPRVLNTIAQVPGAGGALVTLGYPSALVEKDGWIYMANLTNGLKTVDLHPDIYVAVKPSPIIVIDDDGHPKQDYKLEYTIVPAPGTQVQTANVSLYQNGSTITTLPATIGEGTFTIYSSQTFTTSSNYSLLLNVVPNTGNTLQNSTAPITKKIDIPISPIKVWTTEDVPVLLDGKDEIRFANGKKNKKVYTIDLTGTTASGICTNVTGTIRMIDLATNKTVTVPPSTATVQYYPAEYPLEVTQTADGKYHVKIKSGANPSPEKFMITNRPKNDAELSVSGVAPLYGGIGKHGLQIVLNNVTNVRAVEPVGVFVLGIDGLRQDVLYSPQSSSGNDVKASYIDPTGCSGHSCFTSLSDLKGFCAVMGGKYSSGLFSSSCDPAGAGNKHIKLPDVTAIFPSITFASWASMFTGKPPKETGILGNEFFARDRVNIDSSDVPGLGDFPRGMITLDADGGAFKPSGLFAPKHAIPAEVFSSTQTEKRAASAPSRVLLSNPAWSDINTIVNSRFKNNSGYNIDVKCETTADECRTVSVFNQYPLGSIGGVDRWSTASLSLATLTDFLTQNMLINATILDKSAVNETQSFISNYFQNLNPDGKQKRFPAVFSVYLAGLDHDAHLEGMGNYLDFLKGTSDPQVVNIVDALRQKDEFENKIFIVTADHGHTAMPTDLRYKRRMPVVDAEGQAVTDILGNPQYTVDTPLVDMSCKLDTAGYDEENTQNEQRANNALHIWELANLFAQFPATSSGVELKILAPEEIVTAVKNKGSSSNINSANIIAALNGPMAHIYVKGANWSGDPDQQIVLSVVDTLLMAFKDQTGVPDEHNKILHKEFPNLLSSIDEILIREKTTSGIVYKVVEGIHQNGQGVWGIIEFCKSNGNYPLAHGNLDA